MSTISSPRQRFSLGMLAVLAVGAAGLWWTAPQLVSGYQASQPFWQSSVFFPRIALAMICLGTIVQFGIVAARGLPDAEEFDGGESDPRTAMMALVLFAVYAAAIPLVGYILASLCFIWGLARLLKVSNRIALGMALGLTGVLYFLFVVILKVWLPQPILWSILG